MATYTNSPAVSAAVAATSTLGLSTSATLYTCPANSYAIIRIDALISGGSADGIVTVGGIGLTGQNGSNDIYENIHVGPGQTIVFTTDGTRSGTVTAVGVQFTNQA